MWLSLMLVCGLGIACVTAQDGLRPNLLRGGGGASRSAVLEEGGGTRRSVLGGCPPSDPSCSPLAVTWREAAAPAALLAAAPLLTKLLAMLGVPARAQWVVCVLLLGSSSAVAAWGLPNATVPWARARPGPGSTPPPRLVATDITGAVARRLDGTANAPAAAALGRWAAQWERGVASEAGAADAEVADAEARAAAKLLLFGERGGPLARAAVRGIVSSGAVRADDVLQLSAADADEGGGGGGTIERFLATRTEARRPSLVVVEGLDGCGSDAAFDRSISPLERLIEPTLNQPVDTAYGPVRASLHAVLLVAGLPTGRALEACAQMRADAAAADPSGGGSGGSSSSGEARLQQVLDAELEVMWPRHMFSSGVNAAKRAIVNRIAGAKALLCEAEAATPS